MVQQQQALLHDGDDDDGLQHYRVLGLSRAATPDQIKQAYRRLARTLHPDKGGSSTAFGALQTAFEVLSHPKSRAVYDALAADVRFRPGAAAAYATSSQNPEHSPTPPPGLAEAMLLQQLLRGCPSSSTDPTRQLCVTCEMCRRPATKECWTCSMAICDFCTRRQHWKGSIALHWPLVNSPGRMVEQLGRQELELKRKEDGQAYTASLPGYRPQSELQVLRDFQDAIVDLLAAPKQQHQQQQQLQDLSKPTAASIPAGSSSSSSRIGSSGGDSSSSLVTAAAPGALVSSKQVPGSGFSAASSPFALSSSSKSNSIIATTSISSSSSITTTTTSSSSSSSRALSTLTGSSSTNRCLRAWQAASPARTLQLQGHFDMRLARFYMWAQTPAAVLLAIHMPTGGTSKPPQLDIEATSSTLRLQHQGFAPVLNRAWRNPIDPSSGVTSWVSGDGQLVSLVVPKAHLGQTWSSCFKGDSHAARCLQVPYQLLQLPHEVQLELPLPFWVVPDEDVEVRVGERALTVTVDGVMKLTRSYWRDEGQAAKLGSSYQVVDIAASSWCVMEQQQQLQSLLGAMAPPAAASTAAASAAASTAGAGLVGSTHTRLRPHKLLSITLALPGPTQDEVMYKKGVRQNNAAATRSCSNGAGRRGRAFFVEDEDEFGLQSVLQALMFHEAGYSWLVPKPWEVASGAVAAAVGVSSSSGLTGRWVREGGGLPAEVMQHLKWLRGAQQGLEGEEEEQRSSSG